MKIGNFKVCWWKKLHVKNETIETIINRVNIVHVKKEKQFYNNTTLLAILLFT